MKRVFIFVVIILFSPLALANHWFAGTGLGWALVNKLPDQGISGEGSPQDDYLGGLVDPQYQLYVEGGYLWQASARGPALSLSMQLQHGFETSTHGIVKQFSWQDNYDYQYSIINNELLFIGTIGLPITQKISGFIFGGLGPAYNQTDDYHESPRPDLVFPHADMGFNNKKTWGLAYTLGIGAAITINKRADVLIRYQYLDSGKYQLGVGNVMSGVSGPSGHLRSNGFLIGIREKF